MTTCSLNVPGGMRTVPPTGAASIDVPVAGLSEGVEEISVEPADSSYRSERARLRLGGECGAAHEAAQIGAVIDQRIETIEIGLDLVDRAFLQSQLKQRARIAPRHA